MERGLVVEKTMDAKDIKSLVQKIEYSRWGKNIKVFANDVNLGLQYAVAHWYKHGDIQPLNTIVNAFSDKNKELIICELESLLPLKYNLERQVFKSKGSDWKKQLKKLSLSKISPLDDVKIVTEKKSGLIKVDKPSMELPELHSFILDAMVLCRNKFSEEQIEELYQTINLMHTKRIKRTV